MVMGLRRAAAGTAVRTAAGCGAAAPRPLSGVQEPLPAHGRAEPRETGPDVLRGTTCRLSLRAQSVPWNPARLRLTRAHRFPHTRHFQYARTCSGEADNQLSNRWRAPASGCSERNSTSHSEPLRKSVCSTCDFLIPPVPVSSAGDSGAPPSRWVSSRSTGRRPAESPPHRASSRRGNEAAGSRARRRKAAERPFRLLHLHFEDPLSPGDRPTARRWSTTGSMMSTDSGVLARSSVC